MKLETFFDDFELLAEAPNGVQKLRELILQLAVQGKLVPQDEKDEPASVLLKNIKAYHIKRSYQSIEKHEKIFDQPKSWEWVRLGEILTFEYGEGLPESKRTKNGKYPVYGSNGIVGYHDKFLIDKPGIIVGRKGSCGALNICFEPFWATDVSYFVIPPAGMDLKFAYILLKSLNLEKLGKGIKPGLNRNEAYGLVTTLPPFNEQKRIVAKVDQLMSLCDELEARQQKKRESRAHLNSAALDRLLAARVPDDFAQSWRHIHDNFDVLYDTPGNVGALRQAILQLAIMGKLVPQDQNDEPASVLLEKIKDNKERLIKEKKIKRTEPMPLIKTVPYEIPKGWEWARFCGVATIASNLVHPRYYLDLPHIAPDNIEKQTGRLLSYRTVREDNVRSGNHQFFSGQILYSKIRPNLAKATVVDFDGLCSADMYPVNAHIDSKYLLKYMLSPTFLSMSVKNDTRVAMPKINQNELNKILVSVPPLEEQRRIVARVDQLMSLCDSLEAGLARSQADGGRLMEAVVGRMLAG